MVWLGTLPGEFAVRRVHRGTAPTSSYWLYGGVGAVPRGALLSVDYLANVPRRATRSRGVTKNKRALCCH
ncbi:hypothetical protein LX90_001695 [Lentzea flava]|nr:hypothetical protein [Lentzea flava]